MVIKGLGHGNTNTGLFLLWWINSWAQKQTLFIPSLVRKLGSQPRNKFPHQNKWPPESECTRNLVVHFTFKGLACSLHANSEVNKYFLWILQNHPLRNYWRSDIHIVEVHCHWESIFFKSGKSPMIIKSISLYFSATQELKYLGKICFYRSANSVN